MAYTNNVPQATQTIAATQPSILDNFTFIQSSVGQEHNFNAAGSGTDMYHKQASMPNRSGGDPASLPAGTNGMYYVNGGNAKFYDGTTICKLTEGSAAANGYQWIGRVLIQWGTATTSGTSTPNATINFPLEFPNACFAAVSNTTETTTNRNFTVIYGKSTNQLQVTAINSSGNAQGSVSFFWMAIGN